MEKLTVVKQYNQNFLWIWKSVGKQKERSKTYPINHFYRLASLTCLYVEVCRVYAGKKFDL